MRLLILLALAVTATGCDNRSPLVRQAEDAVRSQLRDPGSAEFKDVAICDKPNAVSGLVNAKNAYGGATGFQMFVFADGQAVVDAPEALARQSLPGEFSRLADLCFDESLHPEYNAGATNLEGNLSAAE